MEYLECLYKHSLLFQEINKEKPIKILEVGTGTGSMSIFLSHLGYEVRAIDNNIELLNRAQTLNRKMNGNARFVFCDAFKIKEKIWPNKFDVVFSQGFFEHFRDEDIKRLLNEQLEVGKTIFFSVPSNFYPKKDFGDERLLDTNQWQKILRCFPVEYVRYYGRYPIEWKKALWNLMSEPRKPVLKPLHILAKIKKLF